MTFSIREALLILIGVLVLLRLAYYEALTWQMRNTSCDCKHRPTCPFYEEES